MASATSMDKRIAQKKKLARTYLPMKGNKKILDAIYEQIETCEELFTPLTEGDIIKMTEMKSDIEIEIYTHDIKLGIA